MKDSDEEEEVAEAAADAIATAVAAAAADSVADAVAENGTPSGTKITISEDIQNDSRETGVSTTRTSVKVEMPNDTTPAGEEIVPEHADEAMSHARAIVADAKAIKQEEAKEMNGKLSYADIVKGKKRKAGELETEGPEEEIITELVSKKEQTLANGEKVAEGPDGEIEAVEGKATKPAKSGRYRGTSKGKQDAPETKAEQPPPAKRQRVMVPAEDFRKQKMQKRALMGLSATLAVGWVSIEPYIWPLLPTAFG